MPTLLAALAVLSAAAGVDPAAGQDGDAAAPPAGRALREDVGVRIDVAPPGEAAAEPAAPTATGVDESALRYYASRNDYARVDAEIARLKRLDPGWQPPRDLFGPGGGGRQQAESVDVSSLWAAYERHDYDAVRIEIGVLRRLYPDWEPPRNLLDLMRANEVRAALGEARDGERWERIVQLHDENRDLFGPAPDRIENLWIAAEAYHALGADDDAYGLYREVLTASTDADLRLSTLQKALANRQDQLLAGLFEAEEALPKDQAQAARFAAIKRDYRGDGDGGATAAAADPERAKLGAALGRLGRGAATPDEVAWLARAAEERRDANAAQVLGWHHFDRKDWAEARSWFERSMDWGASPKAAEGLTYTYLKLDRPDDARALAATWGTRAPGLEKALASARTPAAWERLQGGDPARALRLATEAAARSAAPDPSLSLVRGWSLYELDRPTEAAAAFEAALRQAGDADEALRQDASHGLALAQLARGLTDDARRTMRSVRLPPDDADRFETALMSQEAIDAYEAGRYEEAVALVEQLKRLPSADPALERIEGWSLFHLKRYREAEAVFTELQRSYQDPAAAEGLRAVQSRHYPSANPG